MQRQFKKFQVPPKKKQHATISIRARKSNLDLS